MDNNNSKNQQKVKEVILSEETLKELDTLNERIDSLTVKSDIKFGRVIETKKKESNKNVDENKKKITPNPDGSDISTQR